MARLYGKASKYLITFDKLEAVTALLYACVLLFIWYVVFIKNFHYFSNFAGIFALAIIFGPLGWYAYHQARKHERSSDNFYHGRSGEGAIWYELKKLSDDFVVFQDVKLGGSWNIDFIVLGPTGLFTIEVKSHYGDIAFNGQGLTRNGYLFQEKDILRQARGQALVLHNFLGEKLSQDIFVQPVLAFASSMAKMRFGFRPVDNVFVVQRRFLLELLNARARNFSSDIISKIETELRLYTPF